MTARLLDHCGKQSHDIKKLNTQSPQAATQTCQDLSSLERALKRSRHGHKSLEPGREAATGGWSMSWIGSPEHGTESPLQSPAPRDVSQSEVLVGSNLQLGAKIVSTYWSMLVYVNDRAFEIQGSWDTDKHPSLILTLSEITSFPKDVANSSSLSIPLFSCVFCFALLLHAVWIIIRATWIGKFFLTEKVHVLLENAFFPLWDVLYCLSHWYWLK